MASEPRNQHDPQFLPAEPSKRKLNFDSRLILTGFIITIPGVLAAEILLWIGSYSLELKWTVTLFIGLAWLIGSSMLHGQIVRPLQTLSNMVAAIREEDFSFRLRGEGREDTLSDLILEINALATRLQQQKVSALEATALLKKV